MFFSDVTLNEFNVKMFHLDLLFIVNLYTLAYR